MTDKQKNLIVRTLTGVVFVATLVSCIVLHPLAFGILFAIITGLSIWEFCDVVGNREDIALNHLLCTVAGVYLFVAFWGYFNLDQGGSIFIPYLITIVYLLISELYLQQPSPINNWAYTMMSQLYVALPLALLNVLAFQSDEAGQIHYQMIYPLAVFIFLWSGDTGAYCVGSLIGKHKLFPRISPAKSWEGSIGGGVVALLASVALWYFFPVSLTLLQWLGFALVVVVFGTWGDLVESLLKRQLGIKDSGHILPGHGGMLDRFDSSLLAIPAVVVYLYTISL